MRLLFVGFCNTYSVTEYPFVTIVFSLVKIFPELLVQYACS
jgi:hypothetical protein